MAEKKVKGKLPDLIGLADLAKLVGLSKAYVAQMASQGIFPNAAPGYYDPVECVAVFYRQQQKDSPRRQMDEEKAKKLQRENAVAERKYVPVSELEATIGEICVIFNQGMSALPGRVSSAGAMCEAGVLSEIVRVEVAAITNAIDAVIASAEENVPASDAQLDKQEGDKDPGQMGS